jgi:DNA phosphorothioation-associated putative methyltransferase
MSIGKFVGDDHYVHLAYLTDLQSDLHRSLISSALEAIQTPSEWSPNVVKINRRTHRISLLAYANFDEMPFPELVASWSFSPESTQQPTLRSYTTSLNPPILHRKELLVAESHPKRERWVSCTRSAEQLGLFDDPITIGFRMNWERLIQSKGYRLVDGEFHPLGNNQLPDEIDADVLQTSTIQRHLTALSRTNLSAPVQLLFRHGLLEPGQSFFDYGCGRGSDVEALSEYGVIANGWDPYYANEQPLVEADAVNLGFVVNVIEDPAERVEAIRKAYGLSKRVMSIGVMLYGPDIPGKPFRDGFLTSRNTFQKYFTQPEFRDYIEHVLSEEVFMVGPGVAIVFKNQDEKQRFAVERYRTSNVAARLLRANRPTFVRDPIGNFQHKRVPRQSISDKRYEAGKPLLDALWEQCLELGRYPDAAEISSTEEIKRVFGSLGSAFRQIADRYDIELLRKSQATRRSDLLLFFAIQQFRRRPPFRTLESRLQRDVKAFFGDYGQAQQQGMRLLQEAADQTQIRNACVEAAQNGLGFLHLEQSLLVHNSLVERLPAILRIYVACGLILYEESSEVQLVKIHIDSGKLTLLQYEDFEQSAVPLLSKRIKVNIRKQDYDEFEYGDPKYPKQMLAWKSRYINEDTPGFAEQQSFDEQLESIGFAADPEHGHFSVSMMDSLGLSRYKVSGLHLLRSDTFPDIDQRCGSNLTYRDLIECGETQQRTRLANLPRLADSYNALNDLASKLLDPIIDYFGSIQLTYGFCSLELSKLITSRVAPKLDQHAAHELDGKGRPVCDRLGAACDFIVEDENMREVADWIIDNLPFDRLYFYADDRPIHLSFGPQNSRLAFELRNTANGVAVPRPYSSSL